MSLVEPAAVGERVEAVDVLRGVALLGIFVMNIPYFALPGAAAEDPTVAGGFTGADFWTWAVSYVVFDMKMMAIFSMLFGAGLVLMGERVEARGGSFRGFYYRRVAWLLVIGLIHAYLIWPGDILVAYALCGMLIYPFRHLAPRTLILVGGLVMLVAVPILFAYGLTLGYARDQAAKVEALKTAGQAPENWRRDLAKRWKEAEADAHPTPRAIADETRIQRGPIGPILRQRAGQALGVELFYFPAWIAWRAGGLMLLGMGLMKLGVFRAECTPRFYTGLIGFGYAVGLPLVVLGASGEVAHRFDLVYTFQVGTHLNYVGSVFVALGHVGVVMLVCQARQFPWLTRRLAAVGRMALSNYLMHSLIGDLLFEGGKLFGRIDRSGLMGVVATVWAVQLLVSPLWLEHFRFGPAEWVWRSLTYGAWQPMRRVQP